MIRLLYKSLVRPALFSLEPERAHAVAMRGLKVLGGVPAMVRMLRGVPDPRLARTVFGIRFPSPIGLAAGFDKDGVVLPAWEALGFGAVEVGTITALAQPGNPKPRVIRYKAEEALVNRMGFNNSGAEALALRLEALKNAKRWPSIPVGINLGKSKATPVDKAAEDYCTSFGLLREYGDYFVINVSSPNTPGLRSLQAREALEPLVRAIQSVNVATTPFRPVLVKIAPDLTEREIEDVLDLSLQEGVAGIIATNTTIDRSACPAASEEGGGLSGRPLRKRALEVLKFIVGRTSLPVVASGGVCDADAAMEKFDAGAALVQVYTGFIYEGPYLIRDIEQAILARSV